MPRYIVIAKRKDGEGYDWKDLDASCPEDAIEKSYLFPAEGIPFHVYGISNYNQYVWEPRKLTRISTSPR